MGVHMRSSAVLPGVLPMTKSNEASRSVLELERGVANFFGSHFVFFGTGGAVKNDKAQSKLGVVATALRRPFVVGVAPLTGRGFVTGVKQAIVFLPLVNQK